MTTGWATALTTVLILFSQTSWANEITINQIGDGLKLDVIQDGENNQVKPITSGSDNVKGDNNIVINHQWGNNHLTEQSVDGDSNTVINVQGGGGNNGFIRSSTTGRYNYVGTFQGFHYDGFGFYSDNDETGGHEAYVSVNGDFNNYMSTQTDTNRAGGGGSPHHLSNVIEGDFNNVQHTQMGKAGHDGFIEVQGDSNSVELYQRGNQGQHFADIVVDDYNNVSVTQRGTGSHSAAVDLSSSNGPAYNFSLTQDSANNQSYTMTGICNNPNGCSVSVVQN